MDTLPALRPPLYLYEDTCSGGYFVVTDRPTDTLHRFVQEVASPPALITPAEAAVALEWNDVLDDAGALEPDEVEAAVIARLRRIAGDS